MISSKVRSKIPVTVFREKLTSLSGLESMLKSLTGVERTLAIGIPDVSVKVFTASATKVFEADSARCGVVFVAMKA